MKKIQKALACLMIVVMVLSFAPLGELVEGLFTTVASAETSGVFTYKVDNGEACITDCDTSIKGDLVIPSKFGVYPVTTIGDYAFYGCEALESVTIGNGVTSIGDNAFYMCRRLKRVIIGNSVAKIGFAAFSFCNELNSLTMGDGVTEIGRFAFSSCVSLNKIIIPNNVTTIGGYAFNKCDNLTSVINGNSVELIGEAAFYECRSLKSIKIPNTVTSIGDSAFYGCEGLKSVTLGNGITTIGNDVFMCCYNLDSITIPNSVKYIGGSAFSECKNLKSITIPNSEINISPCAFYNCRALKIVTIPKNVKNVGYMAFGYYYDENTLDSAVKVSDFTIRGFKDTAAEEYAKTSGFKFVALSEPKLVRVDLCTATTAKSTVYTGKALNPAVIVKDGKTTLKAGTHYTVTYKNNIKIGKATITIKGIEKNGYTGTKTLTFKILPSNAKSLKATQTTSSVKLSWGKVAGAQGYTVYRQSGKKWIKVADTKSTTYTIKKLKAGTNYKFAVKAYAKSGNTTYYSASYTNISTATKPGTPALKATAGTKKANLSWSKQTGASGYVVYMATSKNGTYKKIATVKGGTKVSCTKTGLTKGRTYYFKVAAYKTVSGKDIYGAYSAVKSVKAK